MQIQPLPVVAQFIKQARTVKKLQPLKKQLILALDPGETTGWAIFHSDGEGYVCLVDCGQAKTWPMTDAVQSFTELLARYEFTHVVHEVYAVYEWKAEDHSWSQIPTVRVIGCVETLCILKGLSYSSQTAQVAKNFCTDAKLKGWNIWQDGQRHARDAIRHGIYYLTFSP